MTTAKEWIEMRFCLDSDDDGHWYVVPLSERDKFREHVETDGKDPADIPGVARLNQHPSSVSFSTPYQDGKPIGGPHGAPQS